jgi:hypothetical protein
MLIAFTVEDGEPDSQVTFYQLHSLCAKCCLEEAQGMDGQRGLQLVNFASTNLPNLRESFDSFSEDLEYRIPSEPWREQLFGICMYARIYQETPERILSALALKDMNLDPRTCRMQ